VDLFDAVRSCFRRWYVLLPLLVITAWFSYHAYASVKPVYYSSAVIGLAAPSFRVEATTAGQPVSRNGLLDVGGPALIANLSALGLRQPSVVDQVVAAGGLPDYSARLFPVPPTAPPIPLVMIEETSEDPAAVRRTLELVIAAMPATLRSLQEGARVPEDQMVQEFVVSPPSDPAAAMPKRTRATVSIFLAGLGLTVLFTVLVDVLLVRRRKRIEARPQAPSAAGGPSLGPTPPAVPEPDDVVGDNKNRISATSDGA
jgi:hypothetical protein